MRRSTASRSWPSNPSVSATVAAASGAASAGPQVGLRAQLVDEPGRHRGRRTARSGSSPPACGTSATYGSRWRPCSTPSVESMLGPTTRAVEKRGSSTVNVAGSRSTSTAAARPVTSHPPTAGTTRHRRRRAEPGEVRMRIDRQVVERDVVADHAVTIRSAGGRDSPSGRLLHALALAVAEPTPRLPRPGAAGTVGHQGAHEVHELGRVGDDPDRRDPVVVDGERRRHPTVGDVHEQAGLAVQLAGHHQRVVTEPVDQVEQVPAAPSGAGDRAHRRVHDATTVADDGDLRGQRRHQARRGRRHRARRP